jgi:hypothetical protein
MSHVSAFSFFMKAIPLGFLVVVSAWASISLNGDYSRSQHQMLEICKLSALI